MGIDSLCDVRGAGVDPQHGAESARPVKEMQATLEQSLHSSKTAGELEAYLALALPTYARDYDLALSSKRLYRAAAAAARYES